MLIGLSDVDAASQRVAFLFPGVQETKHILRKYLVRINIRTFFEYSICCGIVCWRNWLAADTTKEAVWSLRELAFISMVAVEIKRDGMLRAMP